MGTYFKFFERGNIPKNHSFSTFAKFSEKLTFSTPWYEHVRVRIGGKKC